VIIGLAGGVPIGLVARAFGGVDTASGQQHVSSKVNRRPAGGTDPP
jgi:hypothetical protein